MVFFLGDIMAGVSSGGTSVTAPSYVGISSSYTSDEYGSYGGETIVSGLQNDIAIAVHVATSAKATTGGWTQIATKAFGSGVDVTLLWRRVASDGENYVSDYGGWGAYGTKIVLLRGLPSGSSPVDTSATQNEATGTAVTLPAVTTTQGNDMVLLVSVHQFSATSASWTNATLGTVTERYDGTPTNLNFYLHIATAVMAAAGSTGTTAMTLSISRTHLDMTLALKGV